MSLKNKLITGPATPVVPDKAFRPRVEKGMNTALIVTKASQKSWEESTPGDQARILIENGFRPDEWIIASYRESKWEQQSGGETVDLYAQRLSLTPTATQGITLPDLDDIHEMVKRAPKAKASKNVAEGISFVVVIADPQVGKVDNRGDTETLLARLETARANVLSALANGTPPSEVIIVDAGDGLENFESQASEDRTNDLSLTEQVRIYRRIVWSFIEDLAQVAPSVKVAVVPSNHCRVRRGKSAMGAPNDDWGIEVHSQLQDMAATHPSKYGHVEFFAPGKWEEALALTLTGGKILGVTHGHQKSNANLIPDWWAGQAFGRSAVGSADILVTGHFHNLRVQTVGDDRWWFQAPTMDNGSSWFTNNTGHDSATGMLTFRVGPQGWHDLKVC